MSQTSTASLSPSDVGATGNGLFFKSWITNPLATAAQVPSSQALATAIVDATLIGEQGPVIEFGPGTGAFTNKLLERGVAPTDLILVEQNPEFCAFLRDRYPGATIIQGDAFSAIRELKGCGAAGVISGMPVVQFSRRVRLRFVNNCLDSLASPTGRFSQFTYMTGTPVPLGANSTIRAERSKRIWWNLWPAVVWTYRRKTEG